MQPADIEDDDGVLRDIEPLAPRAPVLVGPREVLDVHPQWDGGDLGTGKAGGAQPRSKVIAHRLDLRLDAGADSSRGRDQAIPRLDRGDRHVGQDVHGPGAGGGVGHAAEAVAGVPERLTPPRLGRDVRGRIVKAAGLRELPKAALADPSPGLARGLDALEHCLALGGPDVQRIIEP